MASEITPETQIILSPEEVDSLLTEAENLRGQVDALEMAQPPRSVAPYGEGFYQAPLIERPAWVSLVNMASALCPDLDQSLIPAADIGMEPPVRIRLSPQEIETLNTLIKVLFGDLGVSVAVHIVPAKPTPDWVSDPSIKREWSYSPIRFLDLTVRVLEYDEVSARDHPRLVGFSRYSTMGPEACVSACLADRDNMANSHFTESLASSRRKRNQAPPTRQSKSRRSSRSSSGDTEEILRPRPLSIRPKLKHYNPWVEIRRQIA